MPRPKSGRAIGSWDLPPGMQPAHNIKGRDHLVTHRRVPSTLSPDDPTPPQNQCTEARAAPLPLPSLLPLPPSLSRLPTGAKRERAEAPHAAARAPEAQGRRPRIRRGCRSVARRMHASERARATASACAAHLFAHARWPFAVGPL
eukprot:357218-Chlamydomonas_euryale.AAC.35